MSSAPTDNSHAAACGIGRIRTLHVASGDLWAGAEAQVYTLLTQLSLSGACEPTAALLNEGELARRLRNSGIRVEVIDERTMGAVRIVARLRELIQSIRPHVVHTHRMKENVCGSLANMLSVRAACVRTVHGAPEHHPRGVLNLHKRLFRSIDSLCAQFAQQRIVAVSRPLAVNLRERFGEDRVAVIENGVDASALRAQAHIADFRKHTPSATHIGIVGRLQPVKRIDLFIGACEILSSELPDTAWRFHVIGDGAERMRLEAQAAQLGLADRITFHGHRHDIAACLYSLDALVMCSDHEGMPMTPLEAIALGTPVVAHAVGGLTDLFSNGRGGLLTSDHSARGYAAALRKILTGRTREAGVFPDWLEARFSAVTNARRTLELYQELIEPEGSSG